MCFKRICGLLIITLQSGLVIPLLQAAERPETPSGPALMRAELDRRIWLAKEESFYLKGHLRQDKTIRQMDKDRRRVQKNLAPNRQPDPLKFQGLRPTWLREFEYAFDSRRLRDFTVSRAQPDLILNDDLHLWEGERAILYSRNPHTQQDRLTLGPHPADAGFSMFSCVTYLHAIKFPFWWYDPARFQALRNSFGQPDDFVYVGDDEFHGVDCHVLLKMTGNRTDRYYFGVKDRRWHGAKEGIVVIADFDEFQRQYRNAVTEFFGADLPLDRQAEELKQRGGSWDSLAQPHKERWARILYRHVARQVTPNWEFSFSDYRDLGNGKSLPFGETRISYTYEEPVPETKEIFVECIRTMTIEEVRLAPQFSEEFFAAPRIREGAKVLDNIHKPNLQYDYKENFTDEEWDLIVKTGKQLEELDKENQKLGPMRLQAGERP